MMMVKQATQRIRFGSSRYHFSDNYSRRLSYMHVARISYWCRDVLTPILGMYRGWYSLRYNLIQKEKWRLWVISMNSRTEEEWGQESGLPTQLSKNARLVGSSITRLVPPSRLNQYQKHNTYIESTICNTDVCGFCFKSQPTKQRHRRQDSQQKYYMTHVKRNTILVLDIHAILLCVCVCICLYLSVHMTVYMACPWLLTCPNPGQWRKDAPWLAWSPRGQLPYA